ncbi:ADP-ribosylglycohydrolase family protein [Crossiella cryophila]|uniref:ADP-ribosylglycohydrolase n=1 Tax=Crossiella cryophila TaxID=43355 RepID=A0A7W7CIV0_9PSEU|nr:ADP-ribosylglycohydrolase family protein [Crossiella cryophila]MBB4680581.1 ADP-ribosylglycohydrolase [Crossiella cryophila]
MTWEDRVLGCMLGGAIGDALGADVEFESISSIRRRHGADGLTDLVAAYGKVGAITDDTQMTLFTMEGMVRAHVHQRRHGATDPVPFLLSAYQRWLHTQGYPWADAMGSLAQAHPQPDGWLIREPDLFDRRAPGKTCIRALEDIGRGQAPGSFTNKINNSKGCGGVMRAAPVALWGNDPAEVFRIAAAGAALTHTHPSGYLSAGCLAVMVWALFHGAHINVAIDKAEQILRGYDQHEETLEAIEGAVRLGGPIDSTTPERIERELGGGWVGEEALAIGLYAFLHGGGEFRETMRVAVNHTGDSDSTGAIAGNLFGAAHGMSALPKDWLDKLELRAATELLSRDAVAEFSANPPTSSGFLHCYPTW